MIANRIGRERTVTAYVESQGCGLSVEAGHNPKYMFNCGGPIQSFVDENRQGSMDGCGKSA